MIRRFIKCMPDIPYRIIQGIKNIIIWFPVIWRDRDFDHSFLYKIMYYKLKNMQAFFESENVWCACSNRKAKQIMIAKNLCKRLIEQQYLTNALTDYHQKYGEEIKFSFEPVEGKTYSVLKWNETEREHEDFHMASVHSDYMEQQDLDYLFKHMRKYIQGWWD